MKIDVWEHTNTHKILYKDSPQASGYFHDQEISTTSPRFMGTVDTANHKVISANNAKGYWDMLKTRQASSYELKEFSNIPDDSIVVDELGYILCYFDELKVDDSNRDIAEHSAWYPYIKNRRWVDVYWKGSWNGSKCSKEALEDFVFTKYLAICNHTSLGYESKYSPIGCYAKRLKEFGEYDKGIIIE